MLLIALACAAHSEIKLTQKKQNHTPFTAYNRVQQIQPKRSSEMPDPKTYKVNLIPGREVVAEVSWSAGNKTYSYLRLTTGDRTILNFWGTNSLIRCSEVWLGTPKQGLPATLISYQPEVLEMDTPLGTVQPGFRLWGFDGKAYTATSISLCPLNLWLRNPFPFQD